MASSFQSLSQIVKLLGSSSLLALYLTGMIMERVAANSNPSRINFGSSPIGEVFMWSN